jgi:hypothetical protein
VSDLSSLGLREVVGRIGDAESYLRAGLKTPDQAAAGELSPARTPFKDPALNALREAIPRLFAGVTRGY